MSTNFYAALLSFSVAMLGCMLYKRQEVEKSEFEQNRLLPESGVLSAIRITPQLAVLSVALLALCLVLNILWW
jgi:hypothetical protein